MDEGHTGCQACEGRLQIVHEEVRATCLGRRVSKGTATADDEELPVAAPDDAVEHVECVLRRRVVQRRQLAFYRHERTGALRADAHDHAEGTNGADEFLLHASCFTLRWRL